MSLIGGVMWVAVVHNTYIWVGHPERHVRIFKVYEQAHDPVFQYWGVPIFSRDTICEVYTKLLEDDVTEISTVDSPKAWRYTTSLLAGLFWDVRMPANIQEYSSQPTTDVVRYFYCCRDHQWKSY
jgi:hypothetical protein